MPPVRLACSRTHAGQPPVLVLGAGPSPPFCMLCATATLRDPISLPLRLATSAAIGELRPSAVYDAVVLSASAASFALGMLDALCFTLRSAAEDDDIALRDIVANSIAHICFACDNAGNAMGSSTVDGSQNLRFCTAVCTHVFSVLSDLSKVPNQKGKPIRVAYTKLVSCMLHSSGVLGVDGTVENANFERCSDAKIQSFKISFLHSLKQAVGPSVLDCQNMLADVAPPNFDTVPDIVDLLCVLVAAGVDSVSAQLAEQFMHIVSLLTQVKSDQHREKLLTLISMILPPGNEGDHFPGWTAKKGELSKSLGIALAEAFKPCVISSCEIIRSRISYIVQSILGQRKETENVDHVDQERDLVRHPGQEHNAFADLFSASAGFIDYLFEALRFEVKSTSPGNEQRPPASSFLSLSLPIVRMISAIVDAFPEQMQAKWVYGLPIVLDASQASKYDESLSFYVFDILRKGVESLPVFSEALGTDVIQLVLNTACQGLNESAPASNKLCEIDSPVSSVLENGILLLDELLSARKIKASCSNLMLDVAECAALMAPSFEGGLKISRKVLAVILDGATSDLSAEAVEKAKSVILGVWGNVITNAFSDASALLPSSFLMEGLQTLASALDPRLFLENEEQSEMKDFILYFWQQLPPSLVFTRFAERLLKDSIPGSSDIWGSSGHNETEGSAAVELYAMSNAGRVTAHHQHAIQVYFTRLCLYLSSSQEMISLLNLNNRALEESMPYSHAMLLNAISHSEDTKELSSALLLVKCCEELEVQQSFEAVFRSLLARADSESLLQPEFKDVALPLVRTIFSLSRRMPSLYRDVELSKQLCNVLFKSPCLNMAEEDQELILHVLKFHDTELRIYAWSVLAESRVRGDPAWHSLEQKLVELLGASTPAAKCFVSTCLEGPRDVRELAIDLSLLDSKAIMPALIKVGLPSMVICVIERRQALNSPQDPCVDGRRSALETCEFNLAELVSLVTNGVAHVDIGSIYRLLMLLVDVFVDLGKRGYTQRTFSLDLSILRCLATVLNFSRRDEASNKGFILDYMRQTNILDLLPQILLEGADDFLVGAAACVLDYTVRHMIIDCRTSDSQHRVWNYLPTTSSAWIMLIQRGSIESQLHPIDCRRAALLHLLKAAIIWCSTMPSTDPAQRVLEEVFQPKLLIHVLSIATSPSTYLRSAAQGVLTVLLTNENVGLRLSRLSSCRTLQKFLTTKWLTRKESSSAEEAQFLVAAVLLQESAQKESIQETHTTALTMGIVVTIQNPQTANLKNIASDAFRLATSSNRRSSKRVGADLRAALQEWQKKHDLTHPADNNSQHDLWDPPNLLIGNHGIISSPLRDFEHVRSSPKFDANK